MFKQPGLSLKDSVYARYNKAIDELRFEIGQPPMRSKNKRKNTAELKRMVNIMEHERDAAIEVLDEAVQLISEFKYKDPWNETPLLVALILKEVGDDKK